MGVTGYPRQNNRGMSLDLIESSLGCPLGNWDPWDPDIPDKSLEIQDAPKMVLSDVNDPPTHMAKAASAKPPRRD
jgi:hypothetical protein